MFVFKPTHIFAAHVTIWHLTCSLCIQIIFVAETRYNSSEHCCAFQRFIATDHTKWRPLLYRSPSANRNKLSRRRNIQIWNVSVGSAPPGITLTGLILCHSSVESYWAENMLYVPINKLWQQQHSLGVSSPLCAITISQYHNITIDIRWVRHKTTKFY